MNISSYHPIFKIFFVLVVFYLHMILGVNSSHAQSSTEQFIEGTDTLLIYKDIPGLAPSDKYAIRIRSAATNHQWVDCFANYTYNKASTLPDDGVNFLPSLNYNYPYFTDQWSQTFTNFEMSRNSLVEVEISTINGFQVQGNALQKVVAYPAHRVVSQPQIVNRKIYFTMNNPGQIVIEINGQMDDFNKVIDDTSPGRTYKTHTLTIFANPILEKPSMTNPRVHVVEPGNMPTTDASTFDLMYFKPGVHDIGRNFKVYPGKQYYIPGDAIVFGAFNNKDVSVGNYRTNGDKIKLFGYGTISGERITHPNYLPGSPDENEFRSFVIENSIDVEVNGITLIDPAFHSIILYPWGGRNKFIETSFVKWVKIISWRANGDGVGNADLVEDCFLRTADDCAYIKGNRKRIVFWKDVNAAVFHMPNIPDVATSFPIVIEDCDVVYNRSIVEGSGVFVQRGEGTPLSVIPIDLTIRNFRITDPKPNMPSFKLDSKFLKQGSYFYGNSYTGIKFQNVTVTAPIYGNRKNSMNGWADAPWNGGVCFDNVSINGELLTETVFLRDFDTNEFVSNICFKNSDNHNLTKTNSAYGSIVSNPNLNEYISGTQVTLTAVAKSGYEFVSWSGDVSGTQNPISVVMNSNKTVSASYQKQTKFEFDTPGSSSWIVPDGVTSIKVSAWGGGGAGGSAYSGNATSNTQARGGGGGGGSFAAKTINVTAGQTINYTIGEGGVGSTEGFADLSVGQSGGTTTASTNNITIVSALGGFGGVNRSVTNQILSGNGGNSPTSGNIGTTIFYGGNGGNAGSMGSGGGGGSAGEQGNGGNALVEVGGSAGTIGGVTGAAGVNLTLPGNAGLNPGAGGSGAAVRNNAPFASNNTHKSGGKGGNGKLIILATYTSTLPVDLIYFKAILKNKRQVDLKWKTALENQNDYFTVLKSEDGKTFSKILNLKSKGERGGTYEVLDFNPFAGTSYYKLIQTDLDGKTEELGIEVVKLESLKTESLTVYPNPITNGIINIKSSNLKGFQTLNIYDLSGKKVWSDYINLNTTNIPYPIDEKLAIGTYLLQIGESQKRLKIIIK